MTSVNANYYNATTKNGNPYRKTNANKKAGVALGALGSAALLGYAVNGYTQVLRASGENVKFFQVLKDYLKARPISTAGSFGKAMLIGLVGGAIVDGIVNKIRKHKADKAALNAQA